MTRAARSVFIFGLYLVVVGGILLGSPNTLLSLLALAPTSEPWIRVLGVAVMGMGMLQAAGARAEQTAFIRATVWVRLFPMAAFIALTLFHVIPPVLVIFGLIDAGAAAWTWAALRQPAGAMA